MEAPEKITIRARATFSAWKEGKSRQVWGMPPDPPEWTQNDFALLEAYQRGYFGFTFDPQPEE